MRIISWNMGGGFGHDQAEHARAWDWVRGYEADVFLLQEAVPPDWTVDSGEFATVHWREKANASVPRWGSGVFTRSTGWLTYEPDEQFPWLGTLAGSCAIAYPAMDDVDLWLISLHSSATALNADVVATEGLSGVPRCDDARWWEIDLIADSLARLLDGRRFLAGGDLNSSLLLDRGGRAANRRLFDNLRNADFTDLRTPTHPAPEPQTFFRPGTRPLQLDYFVADEQTAARATGWTVLADVVTGLGLSDHAPIQIDVD